MTGWPQLSSGPPSSLALKAAFIDFRSLKTCTVNMSSLSELCVGETVLRLWTLHITVTSTPLGVDEVEMDEWISVYENHMVPVLSSLLHIHIRLQLPVATVLPLNLY